MVEIYTEASIFFMDRGYSIRKIVGRHRGRADVLLGIYNQKRDRTAFENKT